MEKIGILEKVEEISVEELSKFIRKGIVTLNELKETGNLDASKRKQIERTIAVF